MVPSLSLVAFLLAGLSYAAPAPPADASIVAAPENIVSSNVTGIASGQVLNDLAPTVDVNKTTGPQFLLLSIPFGTCQQAIESKATQLKANVGTPQSGYITDPGFGTIHKNYQWGSIFCRDVKQGAHAVYGNIWLKWKATPNYGYPITDELGATDNAGTAVRYSIFSQGNAIYWTGATGAHTIYGDIYQRWLSLGGVKSQVGFPITDETSSGTHGGRYNDFTNGMIYWNSGKSYVHVGPLPTTLTYNWGSINMGDVTGWSTITFSNNGNARWQSHMHDSKPWPYKWSLAWVLMNADGTSVGLSKHGNVGPNIFGAHDSNVDQTVNNKEISGNWRAWVAMTQWRARGDTSFAFFKLIEDLFNAIKTIYPYAAAVITILA